MEDIAMKKKVKRRIALFFISVFAVSIFSTTVFADPSSDPNQPPASSAQPQTSSSQQPISSTPAVSSKTQAEIDADASSKAAAEKAASASAYAASKAAARRAWLASQKAVSASLAAMSSSELESSDVSSEESSSLDISLPSVGDVSGVGGLTESGTEVPGKSFNLIGVNSLACIGLGVLIVLAVLFSANRRPPRGGSGRTRYRKPHRSKKKRLLNDKYYRNMRY
jgi:hypothetical protein